jgi:hypothetical protein
MVLFTGCANPAARESSYNGLELDAADLDKACVELRHKPILIEHDGPPVGRVNSAWVASDGRLMVLGETTDDTAWSKFGRNLMHNGGLTQLSLGTTADISSATLRVVNKHFDELSLVERGLRHGTLIDAVAQTSRAAYKEPAPACLQLPVLASMSAVEPEPPAAPAAAAAPVEDTETHADTNEILRRLAILEERNSFLEGRQKKQLQAAFDATAEKFLADLPCDDAEAKDAFIKGLKNMAANPRIAGAEGEAVMQVVCAASRQNATQAKQLETALQQLRGSSEPAAKRARATPDFAVPAARANRETHAGHPGRGMASANPGMFSWLTTGSGEETGMAPAM